MKFDWIHAAETLAKEIPLMDLHPLVRPKIEGLYKPFGVACSGGSDSIALLLLVYGHFWKKRHLLQVFHYNHKLRGVDSDADEAFVREVASELGLGLQVGDCSSPDKKANEEELRLLRHEFFEKSLVAIRGNTVLLGHQLEDVAETMLMRIARGSGTHGLSAPRPISEFAESGKCYLRPLLNLSKEVLVKIMRSKNISWREDSSNQSGQYLRNRIREKVYPQWKRSVTTDLLQGVKRSRDLMEEDSEALDVWLNEIIGEQKLGETKDISKLKGKPVALYRRALRRFCGDRLSSQAFDSFLRSVIGGVEYKSSAGQWGFVRYKDDRLFVEAPAEDEDWGPLDVVLGGVVDLPCGGSVTSLVEKLDKSITKQIFAGIYNLDETVFVLIDPTEKLILRSWLEGDRYRPLGAPGSKKLSDVFTDKKIEGYRRKKLPVIVLERTGEIVWVPGCLPADSFKIRAESPAALRLTYRT